MLANSMGSGHSGPVPDETHEVSSAGSKTPDAVARRLGKALGQVAHVLGALGIGAAGRGGAAMREYEPEHPNEGASAPNENGRHSMP